MLDRESTFADETIVKLLKTKFVPVAIDQWYTRRQQDTEGEFWRQVAGQGPRNDFSKTTQGLYIVDATGGLIAFNNNRGPEKIKDLLLKAAETYKPPKDAKPIAREKVDARFSAQMPEGAAVVRVSARVESGYDKTDDPWLKIFQSATSRDNLWITAEELADLKQDRIPKELALRIARFHLIDNTRGEPPVWSVEDVGESNWSLDEGKLTAELNIESKTYKRGFLPKLTGEVAFDDSGKLQTFQVIARGDYWGTGTFTLEAPPGKFPLVVAFTLADGSDIADPLPPHASRGWPRGYLRPNE